MFWWGGWGLKTDEVPLPKRGEKGGRAEGARHGFGEEVLGGAKMRAKKNSTVKTRGSGVSFRVRGKNPRRVVSETRRT